MKKSTKIIIFCFLAALILNVSSPCLHAEDKKQKAAETPSLEKQRQECIENFNIHTAGLQNSLVLPHLYLLTDYFQCLSARNNDIRACDNLSPFPDRVNTCRTNFLEYHGSLGRLFMEGRVTYQMLLDLKDSKQYNKKNLEAYLNKDLSVCQTAPNKKSQIECQAVIKEDVNLCDGSRRCMNQIYYVNTIKSRDVKWCEKIEGQFSNPIKRMCIGAVSTDEKACENYAGFIEFRNLYCDAQIDRRIK